VTRPCRWPDGGCGAEIVDVLTAAGRKQVLDAEPMRRIVLVHSDDTLCAFPGQRSFMDTKSVVAETFVDHHATCSAFKAHQERRRAKP